MMQKLKSILRTNQHRILALVLTICMVLSMMPIREVTALAADETMLTISTVDDLKAFCEAVNSGNTFENKNVVLAKNLDLGTVENWTPIGNTSYPFKGTFDGQKHIIYNLKINTSYRYAGLFGKLENAVVKNLGLEDVNVVSTHTDVGGLAGNAKGGSIENCYVIGSVKGAAGVGGILGSTHSSSYPTTIRNCYARVSLSHTDSTKDIAGISGWNEARSVKIENCYSACIGEARPIAGWSDGSAVLNGQFVNTYFDKTLSPNFSTESGRADLGRTSDQLKSPDIFTDWNFDEIWTIESDKNGGYPYLKGFTPGLGGAPSSASVIVNDQNGNPVTNAEVKLQKDTTVIVLGNQGNGIYSTMLEPDAMNPTYDIYVNNEKTTYTLTQNGSNAVSVTVTITVEIAHTHNWDTVWKSNDTHHWHECLNADCDITVDSEKDSYAEHTYDEEKADENYLVSAATCTSPAIYYKSCVCGAKSSETFENGAALGHTLTHCDAVEATCMSKGNVEYWHCSRCNKNFSTEDGTTELTVLEVPINPNNHKAASAWSWENDKHYHVCENGCGTHVDEERCYGGTATYLNKPVCKVCGNEYGAKLIDNIAPNGEIRVKENIWSSFINTITFGIFCKDTYDVTITASDSETGVKSIEYLISATPIEKDNLKSATDWEDYSASGFSIEEEGKYIIYAKITDNSGNISYISSDGMVMDKTAPSISGVEDDGIYCSAVEVTISDEYLDGVAVTLNDNAVTLVNGKFTVSPAEGWQTICVTDKAGNSTTYKVTVNNGHTLRYTAAGAVMTETCAHCDHSATAIITASNEQYAGTEVKTANVGYSDNWLGGALAITYANNNGAGTAKASITKDGETAYVNFHITAGNQSKPFGIGSKDETIDGKADGTITGVNHTMEYRMEGENAYIAIRGDKIENLAAGIYYVRYAATADYNASPDSDAIVIKAGRKLKVTFMVDDKEYTTREVSWNGSVTDVPEIPVKPGYDKTSPSWDKALTGITADMVVTSQYTLNRYTVTLVDGMGYTLEARSPLQVNHGERFRFKLEVAPGYSKTDTFAVKANDTVLTEQIGEYTIDVTADTSITVEGVADITAPKISGVTDGETCYTTQIAVVEDDNLESLTMNGEAMTSPITLDGDKETVYTIVARDEAGNETIVVITMKPIASVANPIDELTVENVKSTDRDTIEAVKEAAEAVDTENATLKEKDALQGILDQCDKLLNQIEEIQKGLTDNKDKAEVIDPDKTTSPKTGDNSNRMLWLILMVGAGFVTMKVLRKKESIK